MKALFYMLRSIPLCTFKILKHSVKANWIINSCNDIYKKCQQLIIEMYGLHYLDIWNTIFLLQVVNWIGLQINKSQLVAEGGADIQGSIYHVVF